MSAVAWFEFSRGPRTPEQLAVARSFFFDDGIVAFTEDIALRAAEVFRALGSSSAATGSPWASSCLQRSHRPRGPCRPCRRPHC